MNWMLNKYYNPQAGIKPVCTLPVSAGTLPQGWYQSETPTIPGNYGPATAADVQAAMWTLAGQVLLFNASFPHFRSIGAFISDPMSVATITV